MKNDYSFKLLAAVIIAGVITALVSATPPTRNAPGNPSGAIFAKAE